MSVRRLAGTLLAIAGAAGFTAGLASVSAGMRDVMRADGGFCASGGPYVIAHQCSAGDVRLLTAGIFGGLVAAAVYAAATGMLGRPASAGLLAWTALFGALGWNFITLGLHPGAGQGLSGGWLFTGGLFWLMALGGLYPFLTGLVSWLRDYGQPSMASRSTQPLVRAVVLTGAPSGVGTLGVPAAGPLRGQAGRRTGLAAAGAWAAATVIGVGVGLALSAPLIAALR